MAPASILVVGLSAIEHFEHAQWPAIDLASGKGRLVDVYEHVEWVAVLMQRARYETVIARIMDRRIQHAVETNHAGCLVQLVLVSAAARISMTAVTLSGGWIPAGRSCHGFITR